MIALGSIRVNSDSCKNFILILPHVCVLHLSGLCSLSFDICCPLISDRVKGEAYNRLEYLMNKLKGD